MINNHLFGALLVALASTGASAQVGQVQQATAPSSTLQAKCVDLVKPTLKGAERIRDIGQKKGKVDQDVVFRISANGGANRDVACEVQTDGSLKLVSK